MTIRNLMLGFTAVVAVAASASAAPVLVFSENFDGGGFAATGYSIGPYGLSPFVGSPVGPIGNQFSGNVAFAGDDLANQRSRIVLTMNGLAAHTSVSIDFLAAMVNSWDGNGGSPGPDRFALKVNGTTVFDEVFAVASGSSSYPTGSTPSGVNLTPGSCSTNRVGSAFFGDCLYNFALEPAFDSIAHSSSTLVIEWIAYGPGWQGGGVNGDEAFALDNIKVYIDGPVGAPAPGALALVSVGLMALGATRRRRAKS